MLATTLGFCPYLPIYIFLSTYITKIFKCFYDRKFDRRKK